MANIKLSELLENGVHFGHQTKNWNPKMKPYILTKKNGIHIIDTRLTVEMINEVFTTLANQVANGGNVLFVGTKPQASRIIEEQATRVGMPYVNHRWLGGMLTNFNTIQSRVRRLKELNQIDFTNPGELGLTKKELLLEEREFNKLNECLGGIQNMTKPPSALWVVDILREKNAVTEAKKLGIPVYAIIDTNVDPQDIDYPIAGNDDASASIALLTTVIADAIAKGLADRNTIALEKSQSNSQEVPAVEAQPLSDWEKDLLDVPELEVDVKNITSSKDISQSKVQDDDVEKFNSEKKVEVEEPKKEDKNENESKEDTTKEGK